MITPRQLRRHAAKASHTCSPLTDLRPAADRRLARWTARGLISLQVWQLLWCTVPAHAQGSLPITASPTAPSGQRPIMDAAANGVPIAHIAPPSAAGVSRNQYDQFNVNPSGLILNNSAAATLTQQGGWITGNPQLGVTPARIILNEVVSANPSQLRGTIEVAGQRADIVVANPNGIACDGCGFLNTSRATLATGRPQLGADGALNGFDVRQGQVDIGGNGLAAGNLEQLDLIARGIVIEGEVWAKNLNVIAGANQVLYGTLQAATQSGSGAAPAFAIDIKDLGGMYANQVYLLANEKGLGVNSTGRVAALQGNLVLSADGDLTLKDSYAKQDIRIAAGGNATLAGQTQSDGATAIASGGKLTQQGTLDAQGGVTLDAAAVDNQGSVIQRNADGLHVTAVGQVVNHGTLYSGGALQVQADGIVDQGGVLLGAGSMALHANAIGLNGSQVAASGDIALDAGNGDMTATAAQVQAGGNLDVKAGGQVANRDGAWQAAQRLGIAGAGIDNTGGTLSGGQDIAVDTRGGTLDNRGGQIVAGSTVSVAGGTLINDARDGQGGVIAASSGSVAIDVRQASNLGGLITSAAQTMLRTQALNNTGGELSGGTLLDIDTHGQTLTNASGKLLANGDITVASGTLDNTGGAITAAGNVALHSNAGVVNRQGQLAANGAVDLAATALDNTDGVIDADRVAVRLGAGALDNTRGKVIGGSALALQSGAIRNAAGTIATGASLALDTQGQALDNGNGGQIVAQGDLAITGGPLGNDHGTIASLGGALHIDTGTQTIDNTAGRLQAAGDTGIAAGDVGNRAGVVSGRDVTLATGALDNGNGGQLLAARNLSARTQALANDGGLIQAVADVDVDTQGQTLTNTHSGDAGGILAGGKLDIHAGTLDNRAGFVASAGDQMLSAGLIDNRALDGQAARIVSNTGSTVAGTLVKNGGSTIEATDLRVNAATLDNAGGTLLAAGDAAFTAAALDNTNGTLSAQHALVTDAAALTNAGGSIVGDAGVTVTTDSHSLDGRIASANDVTLNINGDYANAGLLSAQKNLTVNAANLDNSGTLTAGVTLTANTGNLMNSGEISATTTNLNVAGTLTNTASGLIDGTVTSIRAGTTDNAGRIYGDWLTIGGGTIDNHGSGTIAARNTLVLGAQHIRNTGGALLYSLGDMAIGGALDAVGNPVGQAQDLLNGSSRIEAGGNMAIAAADLTNRNDGLRTHIAETVEPINKTYIQPRDSVDKYDPAVLGWQPEYREVGRYVLPSTVYPIDRFGAVEKTPAIVVYCDLYGDSATGLCTGSYTYTATDPVWALFGVTPPNDDGLTVPVMPPQGPSNPTGACSYEFGGDTPGVVRDTQGACGTYWTAFDSYSQTLAERVQAANSELDGKIAAFNADVDARGFERWQEYQIDSRRTDETVIDASTPATIAAGGTLSITGDAGKRNENSVIVAGGAIDIAGAAVQNINEDGVRTTTEIGEVRSRDTEYHGGFRDDYSVEFSGWSSTTGASEVSPFPLPTVTFQAYAGNPTASRDLKVTVAAPDAAGADTGVIRITDGNRLPAMSGIQTKLPAASTTVSAPTGSAQIVTAPIALTLPANSLFQIHPEPAARTLIETDPRFTDQRTFLSSDYLLQALNRDPERQLKRYGDGFYEQRLVNDQILALTGQRYLSDYGSTEAEYQALMDAGVAFAQRYQLAPGVALSAKQMALLTTDIVWLTTQTVTLADGSTQQVLVPQVYLRRPQSGDLQPGGALIAGRDVTIRSDGDLVNSGTIAGQRSTTLSAEHNLVNNGGRISGQAILARAGNDLKNLSGVIQGAGADSSVALLAGRDILLQTRTLDSSSAASATTAASTRTSLDRIATVQGGNVRLDAVRDLIAQGATVHADSDLVATAGRDIATQSVAARYTLDVRTGGNTQGRTGYVQEDHVTQTASTIGAGRDLALVAGGDVALHGTNVDAGGNALLQGANVIVDAAKDRHRVDVQVVRRDAYDRTMRDDETLAGGNVSAGKALTVVATGSADANPAKLADGNIAINGAYLTSQTGAVSLIAKNDIAIGTVATQHDAIDERYNKTHGFASSTTTTQSSSTQSTQQQGSTISGDSLTVQAGDASNHNGDLTITGSSLVADHDVTLTAGRNLTLTTARNTEQSQSSFEQQTSGLFTSGAAITLGKKQQNDDSQSQSTTNVGSTVASLHGNVSATAGADYHQTGSQVLTPAGDIDIAGRNVVIDTATDTESHNEQHAFRQSGLTLAVSNPLITAVQTTQQMASAAGQTKDARMQALAGATAALAAKTAADQIAADPEHAGGINVSVSIGSAHSQSQSTQTQSSNVGSTVAAGGDIRIRARSDTPGDNQQGNLTVSGSEIAAGHDATLTADGEITLQAAEDTVSQHSSNSSSSASLGVGFGTSGWTVSASASSARGNADGSDVTQQNSHVSAGNTLTLKSGGDTTLDGAVASGNQVVADIGGNLNIASRQDSSSFNAKQHSAGFGVSIPIGAGNVSGSVNAGRSKINSDYASVTEQSGIRAGDGGFDVQVKGDTTLTGGAITSTQAAVDQGNNRFHTGGQLALADLDNHAAYDANAVGVNIGAGVSLDGKLAPVGSGAGIGHDSGNANSTTQAAISGVAGNQAARTGDQEAGIGKIFDADRVQKEINAQVQITQAFSQQAPKAVADYASGKAAQLRAQAEQEPDAQQRQQLLDEAQRWDEGGIYRVALHTVTGALAGGIDGAVGAGVSAKAAGVLNDWQADLQASLQQSGLSDKAAEAAAKGITGLLAAGAGVAVGGVQGAASAFTVDANNRQLHPTEIQWIQANAKYYAQRKGINLDDAERELAQQAFRQVQYGAEGGAAAWDADAAAFLQSAGRQSLPDGGYLFYATPQQRADVGMYATQVVSDANALAFYAKNGLTQPTGSQLQQAAGRDAQVRTQVGNATLGAAALAGAATLPPAFSWCLSNPVACNHLVIAGGEIAAGDALGPAGLGVVGTASAVKAVRSAEEVNAAMRAKGWDAAWSAGTPVIETTLQPGTKVNMIVDAKTADAIKKGNAFVPGGWATFDDVNSVAADMRQGMAISNKYKLSSDGPFYVVQMEITQPVSSNIGFVGSQTETAGGLLRGGGTQVHFDPTIVGNDRNSFLKLVSAPTQLK